jgi:hypothetical protein
MMVSIYVLLIYDLSIVVGDLAWLSSLFAFIFRLGSSLARDAFKRFSIHMEIGMIFLRPQIHQNGRF